MGLLTICQWYHYIILTFEEKKMMETQLTRTKQRQKSGKMACEKVFIRFMTETEPYNKIYHKWDKTQSDIQKHAVQRFVELIVKKYQQTQQPVSILDAGCGYGKQAFTIKKILQSQGVIISKYYGYDVSHELIEIAHQKYGHQPNLKFFKKNLDTEFDDVEEFDVVISFLALHWVNDIKTVCESIARSLKKGGLCLAHIGLQIWGLYQARVKFLQNSEWSESFEESRRTVSNVYRYKEAYLDEFRKYLQPQCESVRITPCRFTHDQCIDFTGNWIPEVRTLLVGINDQPRRKAIIRAFTSDLIHSIPLGSYESVEKTEDGMIIYNVQTVDYEGVKLD